MIALIDKRRLLSNASSSVVQSLISGLVVFLLYRYLIEHLGSMHLGLWSVILASTSIARLSDMGLTGSVVKFVARYRAHRDDIQAAEAVQTAAISVASVMALLAVGIYPLLEKVLAISIPAESMPLALSILPLAVCSLWLNSVSGVFQSGLDGCQRMDVRNILMIVGNVMFLMAAIWFVPRYGLVGLAMGQFTQGLLLMVANWLALRQHITLPWFPLHWSKLKFKEMFGYAINFQVNSVAILLFDPATKLLMSRYGGLSSAAYYEMANQLVLKLRALLIAAAQALTPAVAQLHETSPEKVRDLYLESYRLLFFVVVPFYTGIWIALPLVSLLWIGHSETLFLLFGTLLAASWSLNTLNSPAYFLNLGTGDLKWNTISHVLMAILNVALGLILGPRFGELGVAISAMTSLVLASLFVVYPVHKKYHIPLWSIVPTEHYRLVTTAVSCIALSVWLCIVHRPSQHSVIEGIIHIGIFLLMFCIAIYFHPYRMVIFDLVRGTRDKKI